MRIDMLIQHSLSVSETKMFSVLPLPFVLTVLVQLICVESVVGQGKIAPLLPEEFAANMLQNKFNHNGFVAPTIPATHSR